MRKSRILILAICAAVLVAATPIIPTTTVSASTKDISAETGEGYTGTYELGADLIYVENGMMSDLSGFVETDEEFYLYVKNGIVMTDFTGIVQGVVGNEHGKWYVKNGIVDFSASGIYDGWYMESGRAVMTTGFVSGTMDDVEGQWYVVNGKVQTGYTGFVGDEDTYRYVESGRFAIEKNAAVKGIISGNEDVYCVKNGFWSADEKGVFQYGDGWIYAEDGKKSDYTGLVNASVNGVAADWYVQDGAVQTSLTDVVTVDGVRYQITNGKATKYVEVSVYDTAESGKSSSGNSSGSSGSSSNSSGNTTDYITTGFPGRGYSAGQKIGRCRIPSVGINVGMYCGNAWNATLNQTLTDNKDSACYTPAGADIGVGGIPYIADHVNQAFSVLKNVKTGDYMYIDAGSKTYRYKCVETGTGRWGSGECYDKNGRGIYAQYEGTNRIFAYTCKGWPTVTYTIWVPA